MRKLLSAFLVLFSTLTVAADESISITLKPSTGLAGTTSYTLHEAGNLTKLSYVSRSDIQEHSLKATTEQITELQSLASQVISEVISSEDYSDWELRESSLAVAITKDNVTHSISTKRFSAKAHQLQLLLGELK